ncbi:hypothetical protein [Piscinibacter sakaiensis]|uniref:hypothetical protein n=1 Tax=Piscinibacter sakaiensis TaxID=1547922 RepID=UPI003AAAF2F0
MKKNLAILFAASAVLAACGGDGGPLNPVAPAPAPAPAAAPSVPSSAAATVNTFFDYLVGLLTAQSETAVPLEISAGFNPPVSETESPRNVP